MAEIDFTPLRYLEIDPERRPSLPQALVPVLGMVVFLSVGSVLLGLDPHMPLLWGIALTGAVGRYWLGIPWEELFDGIVDSLKMGMQAVLILFVIYMLIATWTGAGTIPGLIYYGLAVLSPQIFLPATALLATAAAFSIGSSWTTAATIGVAFMGIGRGLGVPPGMTAGAILTGAYTGDKITPLSDTTNLAAAVTNTDLMEHVNTMRVGTGIALVVSLAAYALLGLSFDGSVPAQQVDAIRTAIVGSYAVNPLVFLPLVVTFGLALAGVSALPALVSGVFAGVATTIFVQGRSFTAAWTIAQSGTAPETGSKLVNDLLFTNGLLGSAWTVSVVVAALALGGLLERTGTLATLAHSLEKVVTTVGGLTASTAASAFSMNALAGQQYMSIVVPAMTFRTLYDEFDLESRNLARAVEASGTTTSALIPWNAGGAYMTTVLGVAPFTFENGQLILGYAPFYFLGFLSPAILLIMGFTGWGITHQDPTDSGAMPGSAVSSDD